MTNFLDQGLRAAIGYVVPFVEACGALVVLVGVIRAMAQYLRAIFRHDPIYVRSLRLQLGQCMVMGLELLVAADILRTVLSPTWNEMLLLAALIGLRTVLNYFVEGELKVLDTDVASSAREGFRQAPEETKGR